VRALGLDWTPDGLEFTGVLGTATAEGGGVIMSEDPARRRGWGDWFCVDIAALVPIEEGMVASDGVFERVVFLFLFFLREKDKRS